jgi:hypothetical protein
MVPDENDPVAKPEPIPQSEPLLNGPEFKALNFKPSTRGRLNVIEAVHHAAADGQVLTAETRFLRILESDDQPYMRRAKCGSTWEQLDTGWIEGMPSMVVLRNDEGHFNIQPTKEQRDEVNSRIIEVGVGDQTIHPFAYVRPGQSIRLEPSASLFISVPMLNNQVRFARYTIYAFPG